MALALCNLTGANTTVAIPVCNICGFLVSGPIIKGLKVLTKGLHTKRIYLYSVTVEYLKKSSFTTAVEFQNISINQIMETSNNFY